MKRVLLKLSGEALAGDKHTGFDEVTVTQVAKQVKLVKTGLKVLPGTQVIPFSAVSRQGRDEIWEVIEGLTAGETAAKE